MKVGTILLPLLGTHATKPQLSYGVRLARLWSAHLDVVHVRPDPAAAFLYTGIAPGTGDRRHHLERQIEHDGRTAADATRALFGEACGDEAVRCKEGPDERGDASASWTAEVGEPTTLVPALASCADIALFPGTSPHARQLHEGILEATLLMSGRPVLHVPDSASTPGFARPLIAWDGGGTSTRAVGAALELCRAADRVDVVAVSEFDDEGPDIDRMERYLAWNGIEAAVSREFFDTRRLGEILLDAVESRGADLLIMGGYGHHRIRETLVGGATRHILRHARVATFLMH